MEIIKVQQFTKSFGSKPIHQDVSFSVHTGECLGLLGGSGAGKSVILRSLIGLEKPDSGHILIEGEDITKMTENELFEIRKKVAYVFQNGALFDSMSVFENIAYPLIEHTKLPTDQIRFEVQKLLSEFNLHGSDELLPSELSGGMQKRVGLARAIVMHPKVVLYDEPTAGLDPANTEMIQDLILQLKNKGSTSILVTHDIDTAFRVCDRICFLKNGHISNTAPIEELRRNKEKFLSLFVKGDI